MSLSSDLISQFVKVTNDTAKNDAGSTVYGKVVMYNGKPHVQLDGSELLTPVSTTADALEGDRVIVNIENHTATITGNTTSPSARTAAVEEVGRQITDLDIVVANKVDTDVLNAQIGRIDNLTADNVTINSTLTAHKADIDNLIAEDVTINGKLTANVAEIESIKTTKLDAEVADVTYATIKNLEATNADIHNLTGDYGEFKDLSTTKFTAIDATIDNLDATYATIDNLTAASAEIKNLQADIADIDTLIFGSASGDSIHTSFANAVIAQLGNAQIKSAMIENVSASKITAGDILTNNVRVLSEDGKLLISDETIQISDNSRVRVQIGKDAANDYSINVWDESGNLMFSKGGITDDAIKDAIIRDDMVSENANIQANKLDISSLFTEINNSSETINSNKVFIDTDSGTLDIAFTSLTTDISGLSNAVSSQGTSITAIQGQISSKIWQQDIDTALSNFDGNNGGLSTKYSELKQDLESITATVADHTTQISAKADGSTVTAVTDRVTSLEQDVGGFKSTVSNTYATKTELNKKADDYTLELYNGTGGNPKPVKFATVNYSTCTSEGGVSINIGMVSGHGNGTSYAFLQDVVIRVNYLGGVEVDNVKQYGVETPTYDGSVRQYGDIFWVIDTTNKIVDLYCLMGQYSRVYQTPWKRLTYSTGGTVTQYTSCTVYSSGDKNWANNSDIALMSDVTKLDTRITQTEENISLCATKAEIANNYYTKAEIDVSSENITSTVASTYTTKTEFNALEIGGRNLLVNTNGYGEVKVADGVMATAGLTYVNDRILTLNCSATTSEIYYRFAAPSATNLYLFEPGETYTISGKAMVTTTSGTLVYLAVRGQDYSSGSWRGGINESIVSSDTSDWVDFECTFKVATTAEAHYISVQVYYTGSWVGVVQLKDLKLEKGNKATDWTPAPEDVDSDIYNAYKEGNEALTATKDHESRLQAAESTIKQLVDSISMIVTDENGTSLFEQTSDGWSFNLSDISNGLSTAQGSLKDLADSLGDTDSAVDALKEATKDIGDKTAYVDIGKDANGNPCLILGKAGNDFKVRITNTAVDFLQGSNPVAYVNNQSLYITTGEITGELRVGAFVLGCRSNGNFGIQYKGGS